MNYKQKYLKYKKKYLKKKEELNNPNFIGGTVLDKLSKFLVSNKNKDSSIKNDYIMVEDEKPQVTQIDFPVIKETEDDLKIDNIIFKFKKKIMYGPRLMVLIESYDTETKKTYNFYVYQSMSDMGFWRLAHFNILQPTVLYKGSYDYTQQTLICIELQIYINNRILCLEEKDIEIIDASTKFNSYYEEYFSKLKIPDDDFYKIIMEPKLLNIINDEARPITIEDMIETLCDTNRCGHSIKKTDINKISDKLRDLYDCISIDNYKIKLYETYINLDKKIAHIIGKINCVLLKSKKMDGLDILLYYIDIEITVEEKRYVNSIPILATTTEAKINPMGIYTDYVLLNSYICKIFEYKSQMKDTYEEECIEGCAFGCEKCKINYEEISDIYLYIGDLYSDLFPLNDLYVLLS